MAGGEGGGFLRFPLTMPHNCHAVCGPAPGPGQLQIYALCGSRVPGGNRGQCWEVGKGAQVRGALTLNETQCGTGGGGGDEV
jgi:hypothetical protein